MAVIDYRAIFDSMYTEMMEEMYKHLEDSNFNWPEDIPFDDTEKAELLVEMITYFEEKEAFEKCEALQKMQGN